MSRQSLSLAALLLGQPTKPRVFVSYHHENDQAWYDRFSQLFHSSYDVVTDRSLERAIDSDATDYQQRRIREENISGSSITVVLCGTETWKRRWVDWEIDMTLNKEHALLGVVLPTQPCNVQNRYYWPDRLFENIQSGFAHWTYWNENPANVRAAIDMARAKARSPAAIRNSRPRMERSRS